MTDFDIRGLEPAQQFAVFTSEFLDEDWVSIMQWAKKQLPENHIGDKLYLVNVAGAYCYDKRINQWAREIAHAFATITPIRNKYSPKKWLVASYSPVWGDMAALDAVAITLGTKQRVSASERAKEFKCDRHSYVKVRNLTAGALLQQLREFESALGLSIWKHRQEEY